LSAANLGIANLNAAVQNMIWYLEGEQQTGFSQTLLNHIGGTLLDNQADYTGNEVKVMNLTKYTGTLGGGDGQDSNGGRRQDQLVLWQVPDSGTTLAMFGAALCALAIFRRRLA
jgi:hypothetical protein